MLISFIYYNTHFKAGVGAGDLATGPYAPHLTRATHTLLTNMYNDMVNGTLPVSVAQIPELFILPDNDFQKWGNGME